MATVNEVVVMNVEDLISPKELLRTHSPEDANIQEFASKLETVGQNTPVLGYVDLATGDIIHGDGSRRMTACKYLTDQGSSIAGLKAGEIRVFIKGTTNEYDSAKILLDQISSNEENKTTTGKEYGNSIYTLVNDYNMPYTDIAERLQVSVSTVYKWIKALNLSDDILDEIKSGELSLNKAAAAAKNFTKFSEEEQEEILKRAKDMPMEDFKEWHEDKLKELRKGSKKNEFTVKYSKLPKKEEVITMLHNAEAEFDEDATEANEAVMRTYQSLLGVTPEQVEEQRKIWEQKQAKKKAGSVEALKAKQVALQEKIAEAEADEAEAAAQ